jgi:hypothetical protein
MFERPPRATEQLVVRHPTRMHLPPNALLGRRPWPWTVGRGNARQRARACVRACMHACVLANSRGKPCGTRRENEMK